MKEMKRDWHKQAFHGEPRCLNGQWRCKDRLFVIEIKDMDIHHPMSCIRFAMLKEQHASKMPELMAELERRQKEQNDAPYNA